MRRLRRRKTRRAMKEEVLLSPRFCGWERSVAVKETVPPICGGHLSSAKERENPFSDQREGACMSNMCVYMTCVCAREREPTASLL